jgi:phage internal scaffolding protein
MAKAQIDGIPKEVTDKMPKQNHTVSVNQTYYKNAPTRRVKRGRYYATITDMPSATEQSHKDECDINNILHDYTRTGFINHAKQYAGQYDDVSAIDFETAMNTVATTKSLFESLPSAIRQEFNHNPAEFLEFVQDPSNGKELAERGILVGNDGINTEGAYTASMTRQQWQAQKQKIAQAAELVSASESDQTTPEGASE